MTFENDNVRDSLGIFFGFLSSSSQYDSRVEFSEHITTLDGSMRVGDECFVTTHVFAFPPLASISLSALLDYNARKRRTSVLEHRVRAAEYRRDRIRAEKIGEESKIQNIYV